MMCLMHTVLGWAALYVTKNERRSTNWQNQQSQQVSTSHMTEDDDEHRLGLFG